MPTCPVCHGQYTESELLGLDKKKIANVEAWRPLEGKRLFCPRCETDIYSWRPKEKQGIDKIKAIPGQMYPLIVSLLALVFWLTGQHPHLVGSLLAVILSMVLFFVLKDKVGEFWVDKWARSFQAKPSLPLETVELGSFLVGLGMGLVTIVLMRFWILPPAQPEFVEKLIVSLTYSLFFVFIALAFSGMWANNEVKRRTRFMPQPIFTNTELLLKVVLASAQRQLNLEQMPTIEHIERTDDAGIQVIVSLKRLVTTTEAKGLAKVLQRGPGEGFEASREGEVQITEKSEEESIARWAIKADMWGRIRSIDVRDWWSFVE